jgi:short-subunit dehydrogenase
MFKNQVVWITGASSGLGKYLAFEFTKQGAIVALSARRIDKLEEVLDQVKKLGGQGSVFPCDVLEEEQIQAAVQDIVKKFGKLDVAIANAGFGVYGRIQELSAKEWSRQFAVNVTGLALTAKYAIPHLKATHGRLVLMGSVAAFIPSPQTGAYGASKAAVKSIGETLQVELSDTGVSCTVIHPGFVDSDIARVDNEGTLHADRLDVRPKNLMWSTEKAAKVMINAISKRKKTYIFTAHGKLMAFVGKHFSGLSRLMIRKLAG